MIARHGTPTRLEQIVSDVRGIQERLELGSAELRCKRNARGWIAIALFVPVAAVEARAADFRRTLFLEFDEVRKREGLVDARLVARLRGMRLAFALLVNPLSLANSRRERASVFKEQRMRFDDEPSERERKRLARLARS